MIVITGIAGLAARMPASGPFSPSLGHAALGSLIQSASWCQPLRLLMPRPNLRAAPTASDALLTSDTLLTRHALLTNDALVRANGFPPRPPASRPRTVRRWLSVVSRARTFVPPDPVCGTSTRGPVYSGNWAGHVVPKSLYGNASFTASQSEWVQPAVPGDRNYTDYNNAPAVSLWTGIGVSHLMQAGVDSIATATARYKFWTEDYPQNMIWEGPAISAGQVAYVYTKNIGGNQAYYFLENVTTGAYSAFTNALPFVGSDAANFVIERPRGFYLPSFRSLNVWNNHFWENNNSYQLTSSNDRWVMTSSCGSGGTLLTAPSAVSGGQFTQTWSHSRPFRSNC